MYLYLANNASIPEEMSDISNWPFHHNGSQMINCSWEQSNIRGEDRSAKVEVLINTHKDRSRKKVGAAYEQSVFVVDVRL